MHFVIFLQSTINYFIFWFQQKALFAEFVFFITKRFQSKQRMIVLTLFLVALAIEFDVDSFNHFFDIIVVVYILGIGALLYLYKKKWSKLADEEQEAIANKKPYVWKKKSKVLTWQQRLAGTWTKLERSPQKFYDVSLLYYFHPPSSHPLPFTVYDFQWCSFLCC